MGIHACTLAYTDHMVLCIKILIKMLLKWNILKKEEDLRSWSDLYTNNQPLYNSYSCQAGLIGFYLMFN